VTAAPVAQEEEEEEEEEDDDDDRYARGGVRPETSGSSICGEGLTACITRVVRQ
jgi:hypothetical protein